MIIVAQIIKGMLELQKCLVLFHFEPHTGSSIGTVGVVCASRSAVSGYKRMPDIICLCGYTFTAI